MTAIAYGLLVGVSFSIAGLLNNVPASRWVGKARLAILSVVLIAVAVTMTTSSALQINAGPLNIWPLDQPPWPGWVDGQL
jgi:hypothetical protein